MARGSRLGGKRQKVTTGYLMKPSSEVQPGVFFTNSHLWLADRFITTSHCNTDQQMQLCRFNADSQTAPHWIYITQTLMTDNVHMSLWLDRAFSEMFCPAHLVSIMVWCNFFSMYVWTPDIPMRYEVCVGHVNRFLAADTIPLQSNGAKQH